METVAHDGRETAYRYVDRWSGPTVCYVHGSGGTHRVWSEQYGPDGIPLPAAALDLSGHGDSTDLAAASGSESGAVSTSNPDSGSASPSEVLDAYARDVAVVGDATDADVLVGNSLGGAVVLWAVLANHYDPTAIALAGSGAKLAVGEALREMLAEDFEAAVDVLHGGDRLFHDAEPDVVQRSVDGMYAVGQRVTRRDFLTCHEFDVRDRLDEVTAPTLAICGEYDRLTPPSSHEYVADRVRHGTYAVVEDAAHLAMIERARSFDDALVDFLASGEVV